MNVLSGLDWRRAFGFFLWYGTSNAEDISTALDQYERTFSQGNASYPLINHQREGVPEDIQEFFPSTDSFDVIYLILKLYKNRSDILEFILDKITKGVPAFGPMNCDSCRYINLYRGRL